MYDNITMSEQVNMFDTDDYDAVKEQVCDFDYFNIRLSDIKEYEEYNYIESDLHRFSAAFTERHVSRCILHIVRKLWQLRGHDEDEDCMYILGEKFINASLLTDHFALNVPARRPLQFSNAYIEVPHSQSAWYIVYYWLRVVRLNFHNWYIEYINVLRQRKCYKHLKAILSRPTIHIILCMSEEALHFWNYTMCQSHNACDDVVNEYMINIHHVMLSFYEDIMSPMLFTRSEMHKAETQHSFVACFRSGGINFHIDCNGRSTRSAHWQSIGDIIAVCEEADYGTTCSLPKYGKRKTGIRKSTLRLCSSIRL